MATFSWGEVATVEVVDEQLCLQADFDAFYRANLASVVGVVYALCGSRWAAEDLAHDSFVATYRNWDKVRDYDRPDAFVRRVAINLARSRARRVGAEARALARYVSGRGPAVQALLASQEEFWSAVRRLPRRQAEVVALRCLEEATDAEIAAILGCSESTVRVHAHQARKTLALALGAEGVE